VGRTLIHREICDSTNTLAFSEGVAVAVAVAVAMAVTVAEALEETLDLSPRLKWPNDVLLGGRKVCGILLEMSAEPERVALVVCGIGLNRNAQTLLQELGGHAQHHHPGRSRDPGRRRIAGAQATVGRIQTHPGGRRLACNRSGRRNDRHTLI